MEEAGPANLDDTRAQLLGDQINVALLDQVVNAMNSSRAENVKQANEILCELKTQENAWLKVDTILEESKLDATKYFGLQILEDAIKTRWRTFPTEQRTGIRDFIVGKIAHLSSVDAKSTTLNKMNVVLVEILKKDWPHRWPTFVNDLLQIAETDRGICINALQIFSLLSEDVFDFGSQTMTQAEERYLKENFCRQFEDVFRFCLRCLTDCPTSDIVTAVLKTIRRFLTWIPTPTVFESQIIDLLVERFLPIDSYRILVIQCLAEVACIPASSCMAYHPKVRDMFINGVKTLSSYIGKEPKFAEVYKTSTTESDQTFLSSLTFFLATYLKEYDNFLEEHCQEGDDEVHKYALTLLVNLSFVDDVEMWKMCLEYWLQLTSELYRESPFLGGITALPISNSHKNKLAFYSHTLSDLRDVLILKMARPEEVMLVESDNGEIIRERVRDSDNINLYRSSRETLTYLTHLNNQEVMDKMTRKLGEQMMPDGFDRPTLSTLCWAIGSIANVLQEEDEKRFLVIVIRDLLNLCEQKRGKDNKAAIAGNIMYVVGQYHRFLRGHWRFLRTVVNKLFEFMHESHEGVQDMACDTFIKIVLKCKRHFAIVQAGETAPFVENMLVNLSANTCDLSSEQQGVFYEAMGHVIASVVSEADRMLYLDRLMAFTSDTWDRAIRVLATTDNPLAALADLDISKEVLHCVRISASVCRSFGYLFHEQLTPKFNDMLCVYRLISTGLKSDEISRVDVQIVKNFRAYRKEFLTLMSTWIAQEESLEKLKSDFFEPLMDAVLFDYQTNTPDIREAKVLSLLAIIVTRMESDVSAFVAPILDAVLDCTLEMLTQDMTTYPEHRVNLFQLIFALCSEVAPAVLTLPEQRLAFILEAIYWAFQNSQREVAELGLDSTKEILEKVKEIAINGNEEGRALAQNFYKKYFVPILEHVFAVVADSNQVNIAGYTRYAELLCVLFTSLKQAVTVPLNENNTPSDEFVSDYLGNIFMQHYSQQLNTEQIRVFIIGFFTFADDLNQMKNHLKDFIVKLRELQDAQALDQNIFLSEKEAAIQEAMRKSPQVDEIADLRV